MEHTEGAVALRRYMAAIPGITQAEFAASVGVTQQSVSLWLSGRARPMTHLLRLKLERIAGIPAWHWLTRTERSALDALSERPRMVRRST